MMRVRPFLLRLGLRLPSKPYAEELGWRSQKTSEGLVHTGRYRVYGLRYPGWVAQDHEGKFQFFIHNPPIELLRSTDFAGCFHARNDGWWLIGFKPYAVPKDRSSGVAAIQKSLRKAFEVRKTNRAARS